MDKREAIEFLKEALQEVPKLAKLNYRKRDEYFIWCDKIEGVLEGVFQQDSWEYKKFVKEYPKLPSGASPQRQRNRYLSILKDRILNIEAIINKHELMGVDTKPNEALVTPKAFIAHEGETRALSMVKEFLEALEIPYFIAEAKASGGRSIEGQVDWTQSKADFAICLATKGKAINKKTGKHYMAPNIADELGRARQVFGIKIILLVQKGVEVHTNVREIVRETFTTTNMEKAFIKIVKELKNWGYLTTGKKEK